MKVIDWGDLKDMDELSRRCIKCFWEGLQNCTVTACIPEKKRSAKNVEKRQKAMDNSGNWLLLVKEQTYTMAWQMILETVELFLRKFKKLIPRNLYRSCNQKNEIEF